MTVDYYFDHKIFLEYLKVILSFPTVSLVAFGVIMLCYKEEIREKIKYIKKADIAGAGVEFDSQVLETNLKQIDEEKEQINTKIDSEIKDAELKRLLLAQREQLAELQKDEIIREAIMKAKNNAFIPIHRPIGSISLLMLRQKIKQLFAEAPTPEAMRDKLIEMGYPDSLQLRNVVDEEFIVAKSQSIKS